VLNFKTSEINDSYLPLQGYSHDYKITGPLQAQASAAYLFGKKGLISVEYDYVNYPGMRLGLENGDTQYYKDENQNMANVYKAGQTLKVGAEYKLSPSFALRAGYALMKSANQTDYTQGKSLKLNSANTNTEYLNQMDTRYLTFGAGYRAAGWFIDFVYAQKMLDEDMYPYQILRYQSNRLTNIVTPAAVNTKNNNIVVTLGIKL
jgi:long-subunit fatty acid transport protein